MSGTMNEHQGKLVVALAGEIDLEQSPAVRSLLLGAVARGKDLLVDLSAVTYIDSSGIASLIEALQAAKEGGRELWTHPGKVEAPYTVCIASASNLTGLVKSSVECRRTGL